MTSKASHHTPTSTWLRRRRRAVLSSVVLVVALCQTMPMAAADDDDGTGWAVPGEIVVRLSGSTTVAQINGAFGTTVVDSIPELPGVHLLHTAGDSALVAEMIDDAPGVEFAELHNRTDAPESSRLYAWNLSPAQVESQRLYAWRLYAWRLYAWGDAAAGFGPNQWAAGELRLTQANAASRGAGVTVAVLDTGVQLLPNVHPQLAGTLLPGIDLVDGDMSADDARNGIDDDGNGLIDEAWGHGTHVVGLVRLVAPDASILPIRVLDADGRGTAFRLAKGMMKAAGRGATVANLSLGTAQPSQLLDLATEQMSQNGIVVVSSSGNNASTNPAYPAASPCAIGVGSHGPDRVISSFSNGGSWVDLVAPGEGMESAYPIGNGATMNGTSMAAPMVAGVAALLRAKNPALSVREVATHLARGATPATPGPTGQPLAGALDPVGSLASLDAGTAVGSTAKLVEDHC